MNLADQPEEQPLEQLAAAANRGDPRALERLLRAVHDRVYRLAVRMTARPPDAEDATPEILILVITRLSTYRGEAAFTTWVHRVAVNYLLDRSRNSVERLEMTFDRFAADLLDRLRSAGLVHNAFKPGTVEQVRQVLAEAPRFDAYWIYRRNFFLGKEIRHSGWNSDKVIRLFQKAHRYKELTVHAEVVVPSEKVGRLKGRFVHYTIDSLDQFFEKRMRYAAWSSADLDRRGVKASGLQILGHGTWNFFRQFVLRLGFLDGVHGLVLAILYSYYTSAKYIRLWERQLPPNPRRGILNQGAVRSAR